MKKTIIALFALAGVALSATELTYWGENNGYDLCSVSGGYLPYIGMMNGASQMVRAPQSVLTSIKTVGDKTYSLNFKDENNEAVSFIVNDALYFDQIYTTGKVTSYTITFGAEGSLNASSKYDNWGGAIRFTEGAAVTFNVEVSAEQLNSVAGGSVFTRTVMNSSDTTNNGLWNVVDKLSVNAVGLDNYTNAGLVTDIDSLEEGQYGWMKVLSANETAGDGVTFVFRSVAATVPEPTTATLSLLALAGLAMRRRRK